VPLNIRAGPVDYRVRWASGCDLSQISFDIADLMVVDGISIDGVNHASVGIDENGNGYFDNGDFAVAVVMAPGTVLGSGDLII
jgi:hypothetical protein